MSYFVTYIIYTDNINNTNRMGNAEISQHDFDLPLNFENFDCILMVEEFLKEEINKESSETVKEVVLLTWRKF